MNYFIFIYYTDYGVPHTSQDVSETEVANIKGNILLKYIVIANISIDKRTEETQLGRDAKTAMKDTHGSHQHGSGPRQSTCTCCSKCTLI